MSRRVETIQEPPVTEWHYTDDGDTMIITTTTVVRRIVHLRRRDGLGGPSMQPTPVDPPLQEPVIPVAPLLVPAPVPSPVPTPYHASDSESDSSEVSSTAFSRVSGLRVRLHRRTIHVPPVTRGHGRHGRGARGPYHTACFGWLEEETDEETDEESDARYG